MRAAAREVLRPRRTRWVAYVAAGVMGGALVGVGATLPSSGGRGTDVLDRGLPITLGVLVVLGLHRVARARVEVDEQGLTVVNPLHRRRLAWPQVVSVWYGTTTTWLQLDLDDGTTLAVMGIQTTEGRRGRIQAERLAALVDAHHRPPGGTVDG
ncbi:MAG: PH domain-containing protein [Actinomycetes bacterium]